MRFAIDGRKASSAIFTRIGWDPVGLLKARRLQIQSGSFHFSTTVAYRKQLR
jgi:hypothetical protein